MSDNNRMVLAVLMLAVSLMAVTFFIPHIENDEVIYRTLSLKLCERPLEFNLQGTALLNRLPATQYDHPIFRHPPFFFYLLMIIYRLAGMHAEMILPVASGIVYVLATYLIGKRIFGHKEALLATLIVACCPILLLTSSRLWIDTTVVALSTVSFYFFLCSLTESSRRSSLIAGLCLGAGMLSKYTAAGIVPVMFVAALINDTHPRKERMLRFGTTLLVAFICFLPWLIWYAKAMSGISYQGHFAPTQEYLEMFPFVKASFSQPWYFYFTRLILGVPVYLFSLLALKKSVRTSDTLVLWCWVAVYIIGFMLLAQLTILGYALRYLLPVSAPLALLCARGILRRRNWFLFPALTFLGYQLVTGIVNAHLFYNADVFPLTYFIYRMILKG